MQEKSLIKKNILQFIDYKGITKYKFYQETGITRGILDQNNGMSEENTTRFLAFYPEVSPEWLLTGKGEMLKQPQGYTIKETPPPVAAEGQGSNTEVALLREQVALLKENKALIERENQRLEQEIKQLQEQISRLQQENSAIKSKPQDRATG